MPRGLARETFVGKKAHDDNGDEIRPHGYTMSATPNTTRTRWPRAIRRETTPVM